MLGILIVYLSTYVMAKWRGIDLNLYNITNQKNLMMLIVVTTVIFWILHTILSKNKDIGRYEENWQEDNIRFFRGFIVLLEGLFFMKICTNMHKGLAFYNHIWVYIGIIVILNIVQMILLHREYTHDMREFLVDTLLLQVQDCRNSLLLILTVLCAMHLTIFGLIFVLSFLAIVLKW